MNSNLNFDSRTKHYRATKSIDRNKKPFWSKESIFQKRKKGYKKKRKLAHMEEARVEVLIVCFDRLDQNSVCFDRLHRVWVCFNRARPGPFSSWTVLDPRKICFDRLHYETKLCILCIVSGFPNRPKFLDSTNKHLKHCTAQNCSKHRRICGIRNLICKIPNSL